MKTLITITIIILCVLQTIQAQPDPLVIRKAYRIWIIPTEKSRISQGILYEVQDSSIILSKSSIYRINSTEKLDLTKIDVRSIAVVNLRKKNNQGTGILIGGLTGVVAGVLTGFLVHNPHPDNLSSAFGNFALTLVLPVIITGFGIGLGAVSGGAKTVIPINGSQEQFDQNKPTLIDYSLKNNPAFERKTFSKLRDTVVDIDKIVYHTVALGAQVWMAENLKVSHYNDGSAINNVIKNVPGDGFQYNWSEVSNSSKLCPAGWHVPTIAEWRSLYNSLGGEYCTSASMKEGFSAGGQIYQWWSSSELDAGHGQSLYLNNKTIVVMFNDPAKTSGLYVRCLRNY